MASSYGLSKELPAGNRFGPREYGGLGLLSVLYEQGLRGIFTLLGHLKSRSEVGKLVQIGIEIQRLIIGSSECLFFVPT